jgi:hypothetical protein
MDYQNVPRWPVGRYNEPIGAERPKRPGQAVAAALPASPNYSQLLPADDNRFSLCLTGPPTATCFFRPVGGASYLAAQAFVAGASSFIYLDRDMIGDLICQAWEFGSSGAASNILILTTQVK